MPPNPLYEQLQDARARCHYQGPITSTTNEIVGDYTLGKTLGRRNRGRVKLAIHNRTGEKFAVKILPRVNHSIIPNTITKGTTKELRALREVAVSWHLHHPYICGVQEIIINNDQCYMFLEYVDGEQMLDYIIRHGRLEEGVARKFARQIGSALDYCHRNNVVHRDIKIENILVSQTGNIKIIDFGLSNLYDPFGHLSTFCGTLYFAAPELLSAKAYTGPEVDVWSFGIVMYILVCGKAPFDDLAISALHAKIRRGLVEYPAWLSAECKHLLSRMIVASPSVRAPLSEVLNHPWMVKDFDGPPDAHLLHRDPLHIDEIDKQVIRGMNGFGFGSEEEIERQLRHILNSDRYCRAVQISKDKCIPCVGVECDLQGQNKSPSNPSSYGGSSSSNKYHSTLKQNKHFSAFDFYRRRLFPRSSVPPKGPSFQSHISNPSDPPIIAKMNSWRMLSSSGSPPPDSPLLSQSHHLSSPSDRQIDPTSGYHPLVSMYFLSREKVEREGAHRYLLAKDKLERECLYRLRIASLQSTSHTDTDKKRTSSSGIPPSDASHHSNTSYNSMKQPTVLSPTGHMPSTQHHLRHHKPLPAVPTSQRSSPRRPPDGLNDLGYLSGDENDRDVKTWRRRRVPSKPFREGPPNNDSASNSDDSSNSAESRMSSMSGYSGRMRGRPVSRTSASSQESRNPGVIASRKANTSHRAVMSRGRVS